MKLLLTLGHNSSAIGLTNDGDVIAGYEEERFTRVKSEKNFPKNSIEKIFEYQKPDPNEENILYVSHWYDNYDFYKQEGLIKRWDYQFVNDTLFKKYNFEMVTLNDDFTHHDAHAYSVRSFFLSQESDIPEEKHHILVADGFGNKQEVISLYEMDARTFEVRKIKRVYGYEYSLGLIYQYATSYLGMKENQDEYKLLGYESHIQEVLSNDQIEKVMSDVEDYAKEIYVKNLKRLNANNTPPEPTEYIDVDKLELVKQTSNKKLDSIVGRLDLSEWELRVVGGFVVQRLLERVCSNIIDDYKIKHLLVAGGIFYNVKLNNTMMKKVKTFSVIPVTGDQGAAIGLYEYYEDKYIFKNLFLGKRQLPNNIPNGTKDVSYFRDRNEFVDHIINKLSKNEIVEVVTGPMEFGPRALCHNTTLALPYRENVETINSINGRNTVMPMAPVMLQESLDYFYPKEQTSKVVGSDGFMIITYDYKSEVVNNQNEFRKYTGVMHKYPLDDMYSGRPQVIYDKNHFMYDVLKRVDSELGFKALINTSYNVHGRPITYSVDHALDDFQWQKESLDRQGFGTPISLAILQD